MSLSDTALVTLVQAKAHLRIDVAVSLHIDAEYIGVGDDDETHFVTKYVPIEGSLKLYVNGVLQIDPDDFCGCELVLIFVEAPAASYHITASYDYSSALGPEGVHLHQELVGTGGSGVTEFTLDETPIEGSLKLYVDEDLQVDPTDYEISGVTITFVTAPHNKDIITAIYNHLVGSSETTFESYDDELLEGLIEAATKKAEDYTGRAFIQRTITEQHPGDGVAILKLYKQPIANVTSVRRYHYERAGTGDGETKAFTLDNTPITGTVVVYKNGVLQTVTTDYIISEVTITFLVAPGDEARITANYSTEIGDFIERTNIGRLYRESLWTQDYIYNIAYTAGYAATRAATQALVPNAVSAVLLILANLFENRVDRLKNENIAGVGSVTYDIPSRAEELLDSLVPGAKGLG